MAVLKKPAAPQQKKPAAVRVQAAKVQVKAKAKPKVKVKAKAKASEPKAAPKATASAAPRTEEKERRKQWQQLGRVAKDLHCIYYEGCAFPMWSAQCLTQGKLEAYARTVVCYYKEGDDLALVKRQTREREPANVAMSRCYYQDALQKRFGYSRGAYEESSEDALMPNIAIYCKTPMRSGSEQRDVHVINLVGYAFDSGVQPDYKYFFPLYNNEAKWEELVQRMQQVWRYAFECARRQSLSRVYIADVGGGNFSGGASGLEKYETTSYRRLKEESLNPVLEEYPDIDMQVLQRIPDWVFMVNNEELERSLLVNAWDPWSMVGNANAGDHSLDGFFGRCTAMGVLCWPDTNPHLQWEPVATGGVGAA